MKTKFLITVLSMAFLLSIQIACKKDYESSKDPSRVEALIAEANEEAAGATEGDEPGLYPIGAVNQLQAMIDSARGLVQNSVTQFQIDLAEIMLKKALDNFINSIQVEKQLYFDGTGYLDGGIATAYNTPHITVAAWVFPTELKNAMYVVSTEGSSSGYKLQCPNAKPTFQIGVNGTSVVSVASSASIPLNEWTHIAGTFDGTKMKVYVNGQLMAQKDLVYSITDNGENFRIGEGSKFTSRTFKGRIRDVGLWNYSLADTEINTLMNTKPTGSEPGLIAYWPFNLSAGSRIIDRTGNHYVNLINVIYVNP